MAPTHSRVSFLDLAPELRNAVYTHCLTIQDSALELRWSVSSVSRKLYDQWLSLHAATTSSDVQRPNVALLSTCRDINSEATPILYGTNTFLLTDHNACGFLYVMHSRMKLIRRVKLDMSSSHLHEIFFGLEKCSELEDITTGFSQRHFLDYPSGCTPERMARMLWPLMTDVQEKRKKMGKGDALDVLRFERMPEGHTWKNLSPQTYDVKVEETKTIINSYLSSN